MTDLDNNLAEEFLADCRDHLDTVEAGLLAMEKRGTEIDDEAVNRVFRAVHSIKGGAGFFDLVKIRELALQTEDALALIRSRKLAPTPQRVRVLLHAVDKLSELLQQPETSNQADIAEITASLAAFCAPFHPPEAVRPLRVLLVEDDFASRLLMQTFLSRYGQCHVAVNGREAVEAFSRAFKHGQGYGLVCMDIMLPEMNGVEAVRQIRAFEESQGILSTYGTKIIMTTALGEIKQISRSFMELCDAYLTKPVALKKLLGYMQDYQLIQSPFSAAC